MTPIQMICAVVLSLALVGGCDSTKSASDSTAAATPAATATTRPLHDLVKTDAEWHALLTPEQFSILREKSTEPPFHNEFFDNHAKGTYVCAADGNPLFSSDTKFESGTGWPSFWKPLNET